MTETEPQRSAAAEPVARRPADLADHLRESRPADLSDYTTGRVPRMRRSAEGEPPGPLGPGSSAPAGAGGVPGAGAFSTPSEGSGGGKRPATLADHLSARRTGAGPNRDIGDDAE